MAEIKRLDLFRINRQAEKLCKCEIPKFDIDTKNRIISCQTCEAILDPFEAFIKIAEHYELIDNHYEYLKELTEEYKKYKPMGIFKRYEREYKRGMLPVCPKCNQHFEFTNITEWRNKKYFGDETE